jgi:HD superfamily phosphohydrolase
MVEIRELIEQREVETLSAAACHSHQSKGRQQKRKKCSIRTVFQHDRDRILHSKSFRRLKYKTQVFLSPEGDHYRTRLTHTLEVSQVARTVARALRLNEDLTEAIALGHDLGHTPFGHAGERVLDELGFGKLDDLLANVGYGKVTLGQVVNRVIPKEELKGEHESVEELCHSGGVPDLQRLLVIGMKVMLGGQDAAHLPHRRVGQGHIGGCEYEIVDVLLAA